MTFTQGDQCPVSLVLSLILQGNMNLNTKITTLIYPFTKQRTSSMAKSSGEIVGFLVPTDPVGADSGEDGTLVG